MPLKRCKLKNGKSGWQWGDKGKCYASKKDAIKQAYAITADDPAERKKLTHELEDHSAMKLANRK